MTNDSLTDLYQWVRAHLGQPIMLDYLLHKVNSQTPGSLFLLLRQRGSMRPDAEIQIEYTPDRTWHYQVSFGALPFTNHIPRPDYLRVGLNTSSEVIEWLKTGFKRIQFPPLAEPGKS